MKKKLLIVLSILICFILVGCGEKEMKYNIRYMTNYQDYETLESGVSAKVSTKLFYKDEITPGEKATKISAVPTRSGYVFNSWSLDQEEKVSFDFNEPINNNVTLYAIWDRATGTMTDESYIEPTIAHQVTTSSTVDIIKVDSVLNSTVNSSSVDLTTLSIRLLNENSSNCNNLIKCTINDGVTITSTYSGKTLTVVGTKNSSSKTITISVNDVTNNKRVSNSTYENKAKSYEANTNINENMVVLCGSSSMENWSSSTSDMDPVTTVNVGIGGTIASEWGDNLLERLVFPFNPRAIVIYVGINNLINHKDSASKTYSELESMFNKIHSKLPNTTVYYVLINLVPNYMSYKNAILEVNSKVTNYKQGKDWLVLIDAGTSLLKDNGEPNSAYFLTDGLHMSVAGYNIWGKIVKDTVIENEKKLYK